MSYQKLLGAADGYTVRIEEGSHAGLYLVDEKLTSPKKVIDRNLVVERFFYFNDNDKNQEYIIFPNNPHLLRVNARLYIDKDWNIRVRSDPYAWKLHFIELMKLEQIDSHWIVRARNSPPSLNYALIDYGKDKPERFVNFENKEWAKNEIMHNTSGSVSDIQQDLEMELGTGILFPSSEKIANLLSDAYGGLGVLEKDFK